jgi:hypothetical protein
MPQAVPCPGGRLLDSAAVNLRLPRPAWIAALGVLVALALLYRGPLGSGFLNDDYLFLEDARTRPLARALTELGALGNYFRPLGRQVYFEALSPIAGGHPLVFHLANAALFAAALVLTAELLCALLPPAGAIAGLLYLALLPLQRVNLTWISCSQDLLAWSLALASFALWRRGRLALALAAFALALASKESAVALPLAVAAWAMCFERKPLAAAARGALPFAIVAAAWALVVLLVRAQHPAAAAPLRFEPGAFAAGLVHAAQSLLGLEDPAGMPGALFRTLPALLPLAILLAITPWAVRTGTLDPGHAHPPRGRVLAFALAWLAAFGLVTGPVAHTWSSYYYTLAAVGGAILVGLLVRRLDAWTWVGLATFLLWWHAGSAATRGIGVTENPWGWTSHLTSAYFERGARLTSKLAADLQRLEPDPARGTRFFFATLPPYAGFQMGNGALIRHLYRDPSLQSHFYSRFSDSTAGTGANRFLYWDGVELQPLYQGARDPWFQVGSDLFLLDRFEGARHAYRRGLAEGGDPHDLHYWLGWTELMLGARDAAERHWIAFGARDDSLQYHAHLWVANRVLAETRDTLEVRRILLSGIRQGIGRPEAHAVLGELLAADHPKFGAMELKVAAWLHPRDWVARRELAKTLADAHLDDQARAALASVKTLRSDWASDSATAALDARLAVRPDGGSGRVVLE